MQPTQSSLFRRREVGGSADDSRHSGSHLTSSHATVTQERENNALMAALLTDVRRAKVGLTRMGDEVRRHNTVLEALEASFTAARTSLSRTLRSLDQVGLSSFTHMWLLLLFVIVFFMLIYLMLTFK